MEWISTGLFIRVYNQVNFLLQSPAMKLSNQANLNPLSHYAMADRMAFGGWLLCQSTRSNNGLLYGLCLAGLLSACGQQATTPATPPVAATNPAAAPTAPSAQAGAPVASGATALPTPPPAPPVSVTTARAQQKDLAIVLQTTGVVSPLSSIDIRSQVSSVITKVHISEGQFVRKGDVLFTLDSRADQANLAKANAQLSKDLASLADAGRQLARSKQLLAQNFVSQGAVDTAQASVDAQTAAVAADRAAIDAARVPLSYARIVAPSSGRVGLIPMFAGSAVQANQTPLVTITQLDPIAVTFNLPQRNLQDVLAILKKGDGKVRAVLPESIVAAPASPAGRPNAPAAAPGGPVPPANPVAVTGAAPAASSAPTAPALVSAVAPVAAPPAASAAPPTAALATASPPGAPPTAPTAAVAPTLPGQIGTLSFVDTMVDPASGTVKAKAQFANANNAFWPGAFVNVSVTVQSIKDAIVIPQLAIVQTARGAIVYVIDKENKAAIRPVQIVQSQGEEAAVTGLRPGEKIAIEGRSNLRPGSIAVERSRDGKGGEGKGGESKGGESKGGESKGGDTKGGDNKGPAKGPADANPADSKAADSKPSDSKSAPEPSHESLRIVYSPSGHDGSFKLSLGCWRFDCLSLDPCCGAA